MVKKTNVVSTEKRRYKDYEAVAVNFYEGADVAYEFQYYNAAGVLIVHSAIAYSDAITIKLQGVKSRGEDHHELVSLLETMTGNLPENRSALSKLHKIIEHKNKVSYSGDIYAKKDIDSMRKLINRYKSWAEKQIGD
jgi:hypothetical protein